MPKQGPNVRRRYVDDSTKSKDAAHEARISLPRQLIPARPAHRNGRPWEMMKPTTKIELGAYLAAHRHELARSASPPSGIATC